jgi:hypothetical protein
MLPLLSNCWKTAAKKGIHSEVPATCVRLAACWGVHAAGRVIFAYALDKSLLMHTADAVLIDNLKPHRGNVPCPSDQALTHYG